ncbi:MAG: LamG domain-containing protein [Verrucomicrobiae bacterium]|nr:LamG domain-containing protein [Verrucomicrobiae bacterium]
MHSRSDSGWHASRRDFLRSAALGAASLGGLPVLATDDVERGFGVNAAPGWVAGVHGYAEAHSVTAGSRIWFAVSSDVPYRLELVRLGIEVDDPAGDLVIHDAGTFPAGRQPIHPGSHVHVPRGIRGSRKALTIECWVRPWSLERLQGLVTQEDKSSDAGFALGLGSGGYVGWFLGNGVGPDEAVVHRTAPGVVARGRWHHVVGRWDGVDKQVWVDGLRVASWPFAGPLVPGRHPIRLGAMGEDGWVVKHLDGDLAQCAVYARALSDAEIVARSESRGLKTANGRGVLAAWDFSEERGDRVGDRSGAGRHGRLCNRGTWMIGGPSWDPDVPRFGDYDPGRDPSRGHGLRLASDDLYDCGWRPVLNWRVPSEARSGIHTARIRYLGDGRERLYDITFLVRRAARSRPAPILALCATNTWRAYNGAPFGVWPDALHAVIGTDGLPNAPGNPPAFCLYRRHAAGQGTYHVGLRMPWPVAGPYVLYGGPTRYSHLMRAERFLHTWFERTGYRFEVMADDDLHRHPERLRDHRVVVLNGHSEYWSLPMLQGLREFLGAGGQLVVLSGNSLFWRVSFDPGGTVMECRKVDAPGDQMLPQERGESWHSDDGLRGGLLRDCGHPGWRYIGLETLGWNNQSNPKNFGPFLATATDHFLYHQPEETGIGPGESFGHGSDGGLPLANGHEIDLRLSTLAALQEEPSPPGAIMPDDPPGIVQLANGVIPWREGGAAFDYFFRPIRPRTDQGGELIYWERPEGGRVFNAGSIGSGWALSADPRFQTLMRNVLAHFGVLPGA